MNDLTQGQPQDPSLPPIGICGYYQVEGILAHHGARISDVVSIGEPGDARPPGLSAWADLPQKRLLRLEFDDITLQMLQRLSPHTVRSFTLVTRDHIEQLLRFGKDAGEHAMIHCAAGFSRSSGCALVMAAERTGPGNELEAASLFRRYDRTGIGPNTLVVRMGDEVLGRKGDLCRAWERIYHGGKPIDWRLPEQR